MYTPCFKIQSLLDGHLASSQFLAFVNSAAINTAVKMSPQVDGTSLERIQSDVTDHMAGLRLLGRSLHFA